MNDKNYHSWTELHNIGMDVFKTRRNWFSWLNTPNDNLKTKPIELTKDPKQREKIVKALKSLKKE